MNKPFRRRDARHTWEMHFGPNMTPMVDVVMVILIFFMASATFAGAEWFLKAGLPKEGASQKQGSDPLALPPARFEVVLSSEAGRTVARGQGIGECDMAALPARLAELVKGLSAEEVVVIIRPEAGVAYPDVIRAHDAATAAGVKKVGVMDVKE